ncbi:MAG: hypothetical protein NNA18_05140 [Nitrospira sp.]|nr:hypothetical protein [Nitrospira sp.]
MTRVIRWLLERRLRAVERAQGISLAYLRGMLRVLPPHFLAFMKVMPLARFRRALPAEAYHLARIVTARHEDCGTWMTMEVHLATRAGVSAALIHTILDEAPCALPADWAEVYFFAEAVATGSGEEDTWREAIFRRSSDVGVVELSMAIAVSRLFPTVTHAMGCTASCVPSNTQFEALGHNRQG